MSTPPEASDVNQLAPLPPGLFSTSSAAPAHTNDMASVTMMSGTRRDDDEPAIDEADAQPEQQHEHDDAERRRILEPLS